ncbi:hypothetical protein PybrP1_011624, partial [[Pythium] brassicae (nom. inval.)]
MLFTSPFESLPLPQDQTIWDALERHARGTSAHDPAFICSVSDRVVTFAQMLAHAEHICAGLHARGVRKGDVVVLHSFNCIEYPVVFFALNRLGAVCSPSSPLFNAQELRDQAAVAKATAIITHKTLAPVALDAAELLGIRSDRVFTMAPSPADTGLVATEDLVKEAIPMPALPRINPASVVLLPFSSGTTSRPKGVELTARSLLAVAINFSYLDQPGKHTLGLLPFFHIMATMAYHSCVYMGKATVVMPRFEPDK